MEIAARGKVSMREVLFPLKENSATDVMTFFAETTYLYGFWLNLESRLFSNFIQVVL